MSGMTEGEKLLMTIALGGVGLSALFSIWIINTAQKQGEQLNKINEVVTDIRTMKQVENVFGK